MNKHIIKAVIIASIINIPVYSQIKTDPQKAATRGIEFGQQKRYDEAMKEFDKALESYNVDSAKVYHNKGWVLELKEDIPASIAAYEEAIKRNPVQIPSLERVGYLYYKTGKYEEAVQVGEKVISLDPNNAEVVKWLPDAYTMRLKKQREMLLAKKEEEAKKKEEEKKPEEKEEEPPARYVYTTLDFMIRTAYYFRDGEKDRGYHYNTTPGYYINVPAMLKVNVTPTKMLEFDLEAGNPYLGALSPNLVIQTEKFEGLFHLGDYSLGFGFLGNHYRSSFAYLDWKERTLHDYKTGFLFGFSKDDADLLFSIYPRVLPYDGENSSGKTLDTDYMKIDYKYKIDKILSFYSWLSAKDYFFFDHTAEISNYWGVYELGFGIQLGKYQNAVKWLSYVTVNFDLTERFYMLNLLNDKPYDFGNGQGWFGLNTDKWFKGDPFSGYRSSGHVFTVRIEEGINKYIFLYQSLSAEMVSRREDHDEYNILFGIGGVY